jgi:hypothetical protein
MGVALWAGLSCGAADSGRFFPVATYMETLQQTHAAPGVKQQLAAVRMLRDWLITGQVAPSNPGLRGARPHARSEDRHDAGAGGPGVAAATYAFPGRALGIGETRPCPCCGSSLASCR